MQRINEKSFTRDEAYELTEKLIHRDTPNYIIRDALIERGLSAQIANEVIREVRQQLLNENQFDDKNFSHTQIAMIIIALFILLIIFFSLANPVS